MDDVTSNNLSRALGAVAGTVGEYARMQQQDRMEQSKLAFQKAIQQQSMQQHKEDKAQQQGQFEQTLAENQRYRNADDTRQAARDASQERYQSGMLANDRARTGIAASNAKATHGDAVQQRILTVYENRWRHATQATNDARERLRKELTPNPINDPIIDEANQKVQQKYAPIIKTYEDQEQQAFQQYDTLSSKLTGADATTPVPPAGGTPLPAAPAAPAAAPGSTTPPQIKYDSKGNPWVLGPDGKPTPYVAPTNPVADAGTPGDASDGTGTDFFDPSTVG